MRSKGSLTRRYGDRAGLGRIGLGMVFLAAGLLGGCRVVQEEQDTEPAAIDVAPEQTPDTFAQPNAGQRAPLELEVSLSERQLYIYENGQVVETHPVAVGQPQHPTPAGEYMIDQVVWNPEWIPPDSEWAEDEEPAAPGDPDNPLGRAQLIFQRPYSIHGTQELESLGQAASHGSIRVANDVVTRLARRVMAAGGADRTEDWFAQAEADRTEERVVDLPRPVPIRIVQESGRQTGGASGDR